jgi:hypothetical protein
MWPVARASAWRGRSGARVSRCMRAITEAAAGGRRPRPRRCVSARRAHRCKSLSRPRSTWASRRAWRRPAARGRRRVRRQTREPPAGAHPLRKRKTSSQRERERTRRRCTRARHAPPPRAPATLRAWAWAAPPWRLRASSRAARALRTAVHTTPGAQTETDAACCASAHGVTHHAHAHDGAHAPTQACRRASAQTRRARQRLATGCVRARRSGRFA